MVEGEKTAPESCLSCIENERERKVRGAGRESDGLGYRELEFREQRGSSSGG